MSNPERLSKAIQAGRYVPVLPWQHMHPDSRPKHFSPLPTCPNSLSRISMEFGFAYYDLCLFHQALYCQLVERDEDVEAFTDAMRPRFDEHKSKPADADDDGEHEWQAVQLSRVRDTMNVHYAETSSIKAYADQLYVVACWAMVEQYCGRVLIATEMELGGPANRIEAPHKWHDLVKRFKRIGVDLLKCENFSGVDECRVVNNKIKHVGFVDKELAKRESFTGLEGTRLNAVKLPLQSYGNAVYEFVGCAMERAGDVLEAKGISSQTSQVKFP